MRTTLTINLDWIDRAIRAVTVWNRKRARRLAYSQSLMLDRRAREYYAIAEDCEQEANQQRRIAAGGSNE